MNNNVNDHTHKFLTKDLISFIIVSIIILIKLFKRATQTTSNKTWYEIISKNQIIVSHFDRKQVILDHNINEIIKQ